jgi:hypothetical protein
MAHAKKLPYAVPIAGRDGKVCWYYRKRGQKDVRLPGLFGSPEFMATYAATITKLEPIEIGARRAKAGTIASSLGFISRPLAWPGSPPRRAAPDATSWNVCARSTATSRSR